MKVLIVDFWSVTPHLETSFEIINNHLKMDDMVFYYFLGHELPEKHSIRKRKGKLQIKRFLPERRAARLVRNSNLKYVDSYRIREVSQFESISEISHEKLVEIKYKESLIGLSVASTLISQLKESEPDYYSHLALIRRMLKSAAMSYDACDEIIQDVNPDLVYVFNGRFMHYRSLMDACLKNRVPFKIHERGSSIRKYSILDYMPHDSDKRQDEMIKFWKNSKFEKSYCSELANKYFLERREGIDQSWMSFRKFHSEGFLPKINEGKKVISFFTSSDDEFKAVGDLHRSVYWPDQIKAINAFLNCCARDPSFQGFIRIHPHIAQKSKKDYTFWHNLDVPKNVTILPADSGIDTYSLIEFSDIVITSGSTVGIESVYWGTPSICLGPSFYGKLGCVYLPKSENELWDLLHSDDLEANKEACLPYGYFMNEFGIYFKFFEPSGFFSGEFLGVNLFKDNWIESIIKRLASSYVSFRNKIKIAG